jgi:hypothetical protein
VIKSRGPGEHKSGDRAIQRARAFELLHWLQQLKEEMKHDPDERALKRELRGSYNINRRVAERAHERMERRQRELVAKYGAGYMDAPITEAEGMDPDPVPLWRDIPSVASLVKRLK